MVDKNAVAVVQETQSGTRRASSQAEPLNTHPNEIAVGKPLKPNLFR